MGKPAFISPNQGLTRALVREKLKEQNETYRELFTQLNLPSSYTLGNLTNFKIPFKRRTLVLFNGCKNENNDDMLQKPVLIEDHFKFCLNSNREKSDSRDRSGYKRHPSHSHHGSSRSKPRYDSHSCRDTIEEDIKPDTRRLVTAPSTVSRRSVREKEKDRNETGVGSSSSSKSTTNRRTELIRRSNGHGGEKRSKTGHGKRIRRSKFSYFSYQQNDNSDSDHEFKAPLSPLLDSGNGTSISTGSSSSEKSVKIKMSLAIKAKSPGDRSISGSDCSNKSQSSVSSLTSSSSSSVPSVFLKREKNGHHNDIADTSDFHNDDIDDDDILTLGLSPSEMKDFCF